MTHERKPVSTSRNSKAKDYKKRAKRNKIKRRILFYCFIVFCIFLFFRFAPFFKIAEIECSGNNKVKSTEIIETAKIELNKNLYGTNTSKAEKNLKKIAYIEDVKIKKKFPNKILINITESTPAAYIPLNEGYVYIDADCKMLEYSEKASETPLPVIQGTNLLTFEAGNIIVPDDEAKIEIISKALNCMEENEFLPKVTMINIPATDEFIFFVNNTLEVFAGNANDIEYKIEFTFKTIESQLGDKTKGFLDASNPKSGVVYRENK